MNQTGNNTHWTRRLFVEHPELYLPFLEQARDRAPAEITALVDIFARFDVPEGGRVLDVACGIGRHSIPLAHRGFQVTGMDISPLFVREAREYAASAGVEARFVVGNALYAEALLGEHARFDAFINMFTSHGYYGRDADLRLFGQLRGMASPGAVLAVLTVNRDWLIRNFEPEGVERAGPIRVLQRRSLDLETSSIHNDWEFFEGEGKSLRLRLKLDMDHRIYSLHELKALLEEAGWRYLRGLGREEGGGFRLGPLTYDSKDMWVIARA